MLGKIVVLVIGFFFKMVFLLVVYEVNNFWVVLKMKEKLLLEIVVWVCVFEICRGVVRVFWGIWGMVLIVDELDIWFWV